jgi:hypothetical protein
MWNSNVNRLSSKKKKSGIISTLSFIVLVLGICYGVWVAIRRKGYQNREVKGNGFVGFIKKYYPLAVIAFVALAVRVVLALFYKGLCCHPQTYEELAYLLSASC